MRKTNWPIIALVFSVLCLLATHGSHAQQGGTTRYIYDENGRLRVVIAPNGEAAQYDYDEAGNIKAITRRPPAALAFYDFSPRRGIIGQNVALIGNGFSTSPVQNTVRFNGVTATVVSAEVTRLVVRVPLGATTGLITVTTPNGTVTSSEPFTVFDPPLITAFTPYAAAWGSVVSITGERFEPFPYQNKLSMNNALSEVVASTATTLTALAPYRVGSGPLFISNNAGESVTTDHIFVLPSSEPIGSLDRITVGQTKTVALPIAARNGALIFSGTRDQQISLQFSGVSIGTGSVTVYAPDGGTVYTWQMQPGAACSGRIPLPATGVYAIFVDPSGAASGSVTVKLNEVPPDFTGNLLADGPPLSANLTTPGQVTRFNFNGVTGQRFRLQISGNTLPASTLTVYQPGFNPIALTQPLTAGQNTTIDLPPLLGNGTHSVEIVPADCGLGSVTLALQNLSAICNGTITLGGPVTVASLTEPGQICQFTFEGQAGQRIGLETAGGNLPEPFVILLDPTGGAEVQLDGDSAFAYTLPLTGTYRVQVSSNTSQTGNLNLALYGIPAAATGTIAVNGPPVTLTIPRAGQVGRLAFSGTAGQRISVKLSGHRIGLVSASVNLLDPNGDFLAGETSYEEASVSFGNPEYESRIIDSVILPETGNYTLEVIPGESGAGSLTLEVVTVPTAIIAEITPNGPPVVITTTVAGQNALLNFAGSTGQRIAIRVANQSLMPSTAVYLNAPGGNRSTVFQNAFGPGIKAGNGNSLSSTITLPENGTHQIELDGIHGSGGTATVSLYSIPADLTNPIVIGGAPVTVTTTVPRQNRRFTFNGTAGQQISLKADSSNGTGSGLRITKPDGTGLTSSLFARGANDERAAYLRTTTLPDDGIYTIAAETDDPGSMTFQLFNMPPPTAGGTLTIGGAALTATASGARQDTRFTFTGVADQVIHVRTSNVSVPYRLTVKRPDGTQREAGPVGTEEIALEIPTQDGLHELTVECWGSTGSVNVALVNGPPVIAGTIMPNGTPTVVAIPVYGQYSESTFNGTAGQRVSLRYTNVTLQKATVNVLTPDDNTIFYDGYNFYEQLIDWRVPNRKAFTDVFTLPTTGVYKIRVFPDTLITRPGFSVTGNVTLTLFNVPNDTSSPIVLDGAALPVTLTTPGQNGKLTFSGTQGQTVRIRLAGNTAGKVAVVLRHSWGTLVSYDLNDAAAFDSPLLTLPFTGSYSIEVDPQSVNTGSVNVSLTSQ